MTSRLSRATRREQRLGASTRIDAGIEDRRADIEMAWYDWEDLDEYEDEWGLWEDQLGEEAATFLDDDGYYDDEREDWLEEDVVEAFMAGHHHPDLPADYDFNICYEDRLSAWEEHEFQVEMQQAHAWPRLVEPEPEEVDTRFPVGGYSKRIRR